MKDIGDKLREIIYYIINFNQVFINELQTFQLSDGPGPGTFLRIWKMSLYYGYPGFGE